MAGEIRWKAPEYEYRPKDAMWYWASIAIAVVLIGAAVWMRNFAFVVLIALGEILIIVWADREPSEYSFWLSEKGIHIGEGNRFYRYGEMQDFGTHDADEEEEWIVLVLRIRKHILPPLHILVPKALYPEVERHLLAHIPKVHIEHTFAEALERYLGF